MADPRLLYAKAKASDAGLADPRRAAARMLTGDRSLGEALGFDAGHRAELRATALALLGGGHVERAEEVIEVLYGLGDDHLLTPFLLAECLEKRGRGREALSLLWHTISEARAAGLQTIADDAERHALALERELEGRGTPCR